ncbi:MAG TPA: branched-chain amino acid ABC transporter substrate-binding protein [Noviherbaspirillum sp.]|uniref:branched-chain amino acid ABC transporter substrate-binding protein n=1 Tax=Noviherbaspirillum sp. TaxID=1926288 RepID=UPI002B49F549|nr:branched-chain amino acid ABC transporter substrate-binding protein [Noviherbaspirillum sp.]HJV86751.1 branched-chain amino acid ABC transporter substrate-binding protein [Noviherbaspirillum sp.]
MKHIVFSRSRRMILLAALCASAFAFSQPAAAEKVVKIGVSGPYSGGVAHLGKDFENSVKLAIEEANAAGIKLGGEKVRFEMISEDDQADPKQAVAIANRLVDAGVAGVVGHLNSGTTVVASKVYNAAGIPQVAPAATNPTLTRQNFNNVFRVIGDDQQVGATIAQYMVTKLGAKNVAVVDDRTAFGQGLADVVAKTVVKLGGKVAAREYTNDKAADFRPILTSIKSKNVQAIFYGGVDAQAGPFKKQMVEMGMKMPLFGSSISSDAFATLAGKEAAEGTYSGDSGQAIEKMPGGPDFVKRFNAKFGKVVMYAPYGYDATNVLINAMKAADSADPKKYLPQIYKLNFKGVTGPIAFDSKGDLRSAAVTISQVRNGKFEPLETISNK